MPLISDALLGTLAHWSALAPLVMVAIASVYALWTKAEGVHSAWVVIAIACAISWVSDIAAMQSADARAVAYQSYVLLQAALIIAAVATQRWMAVVLILALAVTGAYTVSHAGPQQLIPLHVACWGTVAVVGLISGGPAAWPLAVTFGGSLVTWLRWKADVYSFSRYGDFLWIRVIGTVLLCVMLLWRRDWKDSRVVVSPSCGGRIP